MPKKQDKELYKQLEKEIQELVVAVENASSSPLGSKATFSKCQQDRYQAVTSLVIPNKLYLLWDKKILYKIS